MIGLVTEWRFQKEMEPFCHEFKANSSNADAEALKIACDQFLEPSFNFSSSSFKSLIARVQNISSPVGALLNSLESSVSSVTRGDLRTSLEICSTDSALTSCSGQENCVETLLGSYENGEQMRCKTETEETILRVIPKQEVKIFKEKAVSLFSQDPERFFDSSSLSQPSSFYIKVALCSAVVLLSGLFAYDYFSQKETSDSKKKQDNNPKP